MNKKRNILNIVLPTIGLLFFGFSYVINYLVNSNVDISSKFIQINSNYQMMLNLKVFNFAVYLLILLALIVMTIKFKKEFKDNKFYTLSIMFFIYSYFTFFINKDMYKAYYLMQICYVISMIMFILDTLVRVIEIKKDSQENKVMEIEKENV